VSRIIESSVSFAKKIEKLCPISYKANVGSLIEAELV